MTVGISSTTADAMLDAAFGTVYVKLHIGDPGSAGASNAATETDRQQATMGSSSGGVKSNTNNLVWTDVAANETITHVSFWTASSGGSFLGSAVLASSVLFSIGGSAIIPIGSVDITLSPIAA